MDSVVLGLLSLGAFLGGLTLDYLRANARSESASRVDLPAVLQKICAEFADIGHAVSYQGPAHLTWTCRPGILTRAIGNVVDNAVKHGSAATVALHARDDGAVVIDIADDGPGIPPPPRDKVLDPFFDGDDARNVTDRNGFGLWPSIARDVVKGHGGTIELLDRTPRGLIVRLSLPREARNIF